VFKSVVYFILYLAFLVLSLYSKVVYRCPSLLICSTSMGHVAAFIVNVVFVLYHFPISIHVTVSTAHEVSAQMLTLGMRLEKQQLREYCFSTLCDSVTN